MQAEQQIPEEDLLPLTPLSQIREALHEEDLAEVGEIVNELKPAEIARMLESLPPIEREQVWETVDDEYNGEVLAHLSESVLEDIVDEMSHEELLQTAESMQEDDLVDFLQDVPEDVAIKLLSSLDEVQRARLTQILEYDEDSAGGMMNNDAISVRPETQVETLIRYLRRMEELPRITNKIFVVDRDERLLGEVLLTTLLTADNQLHMTDIMKYDPVSLHLNTTGQQVARTFREHDLISAAVVNDDNQLVGRITADDVMDYIQEDSERLLMQTAGMDEDQCLRQHDRTNRRPCRPCARSRQLRRQCRRPIADHHHPRYRAGANRRRQRQSAYPTRTAHRQHQRHRLGQRCRPHRLPMVWRPCPCRRHVRRLVHQPHDRRLCRRRHPADSQPPENRPRLGRLYFPHDLHGHYRIFSIIGIGDRIFDLNRIPCKLFTKYTKIVRFCTKMTVKHH